MSAPRLLHKYVGPNSGALESIASGRIKLTPIDELNDPAEMVALVREDAVRDSLKALRSSGVSKAQLAALRAQAEIMDRLAPGLRVINPPSSVDEANQILQWPVYDAPEVLDWPKRIAELFRSAVGIMSLTERPEDLRMWATYAGVGAGWLVTFDKIGEALADRAGAGLYEPLQANYDPEDPGLTFDPNTYLSLFVNKQPEWESEREWRIVGVLDDCDRSLPSCPVISIDPAHVYAVTAGWAVADEVFESVRSKLLAINPDLRMAKISLNDARRPALPAYLTET